MVKIIYAAKDLEYIDLLVKDGGSSDSYGGYLKM